MSLMEKKCSMCGEVKPRNCFTTSDKRGYPSARCKPCRAVAANKKYHAEIERMRETFRIAYRNNREHRKLKNKESRDRHKDAINEARRFLYFGERLTRAAARRRVFRAVRSGEISRPAECSKCGESGEAIEAHHPDYSKPLAVEWLCKWCHGETWRAV